MDSFRRSFAALALSVGVIASLPIQAEEAAPAYNVNDYYEVHQDKRIYVFDDASTFKEFLSSGETPFRLTRIGAGPNKETVVFGLRAMDKERKEAELGGVGLYDGKADGIEEAFYAEVNDGKRIYVFDDAKNFKAFRTGVETPFRYTEIGGGPHGETMVYVLTKKAADKKPEA
ncbi:hypothetical protein [Methylogaea oryzae]|nr:hypothetical protein [Methylogaea oryzae]